MMLPGLWAVHISDSVLTWPVLSTGWLGLVLLLIPACWNLRDEEIPTIAILTAVFFTASQLHVPVAGGSVHLLLNPLVGMVLGRRAGLAIPLALLLQAVLFAHGGLTSLGVNSVILAVPALLGRGLLRSAAAAGFLKTSGRRLVLGGALAGTVALLTLTAHFLVLAYGTVAGEDFQALAIFDFVLHLPVLAVEVLLTAVTLDFLWRVKPAILRLPPRYSG